jgi:hypothetical protein
MKPQIFIVGYQPEKGIPIEEYTDFHIGREFNWMEIETMISMGVLTPGVILQARGGKPCVVKGGYGADQHVEILQPGGGE